MAAGMKESAMSSLQVGGAPQGRASGLYTSILDILAYSLTVNGERCFCFDSTGSIDRNADERRLIITRCDATQRQLQTTASGAPQHHQTAILQYEKANKTSCSISSQRLTTITNQEGHIRRILFS